VLELYHDPISASSQKVRLVLAELGLEWTDHRISLLAGGQHAPEFRAVNPRGEVPVLVHDGWTLTESSAISEYLVETFAPQSLVPDSARGRAEMRYWVYRVSDQLYEACGVLSYAIAVRPIQLSQPREDVLATIAKMPDAAKRQRRREVFEEGLDSQHFSEALRRHREMLREIERQLARGPWLAGGAYSLAETTAIPYLVRMDHLSMGPLIEELAHVSRWYAAARARPSFDTAITALAPPGILELSKKAGDAAWPRVQKILAES
jgi:glutathione S-transferase